MYTELRNDGTFHPYRVRFVHEFNGNDRQISILLMLKSQKIRVDEVMFSGDTCFHFNGDVNHYKTVSRMQHNPMSQLMLAAKLP